MLWSAFTWLLHTMTSALFISIDPGQEATAFMLRGHEEAAEVSASNEEERGTGKRGEEEGKGEHVGVCDEGNAVVATVTGERGGVAGEEGGVVNFRCWRWLATISSLINLLGDDT